MQFVLLLVGSAAFAGRLTVDPDTQLSLDVSVDGATTCVLIPATSYDAQACEGIPREDASATQGKGRNVRALVILRQSERAFVLTVASIPRPGIGQMYDQQLRGFIESTMKNLTQELGAPTHLIESKAATYSLEKVGDVPVVRWEYTTDLPETDAKANTATSVVYLIPSRDALDILSINTHPKNLEAARAVGARIISTLQVPLTIDAKEFGADMTYAMRREYGKMLVPIVILLGFVGWFGWRQRKASRR